MQPADRAKALDERRAGPAVAEVGAEVPHVDPAVAQLAQDRRDIPLFPHAAQREVEARGGEPARDPEPDAARPARDEGEPPHRGSKGPKKV